MCIETVLEAQREFRKHDILQSEGKIVVTHFSHNSKLLHDEFEDVFNPAGVITAYDGLILHI
jgi:phosphoribosyl 1,2-cyclic phosphate phosphodiesterase